MMYTGTERQSTHDQWLKVSEDSGVCRQTALALKSSKLSTTQQPQESNYVQTQQKVLLMRLCEYTCMQKDPTCMFKIMESM